MKKFTLFFYMLICATSTYATVDANSKVYIVVQHIQTEEFFLERAPIIGCWGLPYGPELAQFTSEYKVPVNVGCGGEPTETENINYLTCAKVVEAKESADYSSFSDLKLDISNCNAKNNPKFITMVRTAAKLNFPQKDKRKEIHLTLIK